MKREQIVELLLKAARDVVVSRYGDQADGLWRKLEEGLRGAAEKMVEQAAREGAPATLAEKAWRKERARRAAIFEEKDRAYQEANRQIQAAEIVTPTMTAEAAKARIERENAERELGETDAVKSQLKGFPTSPTKSAIALVTSGPEERDDAKNILQALDMRADLAIQAGREIRFASTLTTTLDEPPPIVALRMEEEEKIREKQRSSKYGAQIRFEAARTKRDPNEVEKELVAAREEEWRRKILSLSPGAKGKEEKRANSVPDGLYEQSFSEFVANYPDVVPLAAQDLGTIPTDGLAMYKSRSRLGVNIAQTFLRRGCLLAVGPLLGVHGFAENASLDLVHGPSGKVVVRGLSSLLLARRILDVMPASLCENRGTTIGQEAFDAPTREAILEIAQAVTYASDEENRAKEAYEQAEKDVEEELELRRKFQNEEIRREEEREDQRIERERGRKEQEKIAEERAAAEQKRKVEEKKRAEENRARGERDTQEKMRAASTVLDESLRNAGLVPSYVRAPLTKGQTITLREVVGKNDYILGFRADAGADGEWAFATNGYQVAAIATNDQGTWVVPVHPPKEIAPEYFVPGTIDASWRKSSHSRSNLLQIARLTIAKQKGKVFDAVEEKKLKEAAEKARKAGNHLAFEVEKGTVRARLGGEVGGDRKLGEVIFEAPSTQAEGSTFLMPSYLLTALRLAPERVAIHLGGESEVVVARPDGEIHVIMPLRRT
jgi:hypothetical protein